MCCWNRLPSSAFRYHTDSLCLNRLYTELPFMMQCVTFKDCRYFELIHTLKTGILN